MTKIIVGDDCGNAPKKAQLRDFRIAIATRDIAHLLDNVTTDVRWEWVGDKQVEGKDQVAATLAQMSQTKVTELTITNVITHGNTGATDGILKLADGTSYAFCDVYRFSSSAKDAKIKAITSYVIQVAGAS